MTRPAFVAFAAAVLALGLGACASQNASAAAVGATKTWRKITQVENRFAVFINEPGAGRVGDLVTFRLVYIYAPGEVRFNDQVVGWQEYSAMTINCATQEMKPGPRLRYAPDGKVMLSDDVQDFGPINPDTAAADAARVRCATDPATASASDLVRISNAGRWMDVARERLAAAPASSPAH